MSEDWGWARFIDWEKAFYGEPEPEPSWLVEGFLERGTVNSLYSEVKSGKSYLVQDIGAAKAAGRSVLGYPASAKEAVLYLKRHVGQFGEVELGPVILGALECGRSDAGIDENGDSEILGHEPVRISARPPVQIAEPIVGAVCGEQVLDGREPTVYASGTND
jgi:hypothetical protein